MVELTDLIIFLLLLSVKIIYLFDHRSISFGQLCNLYVEFTFLCLLRLKNWLSEDLKWCTFARLKASWSLDSLSTDNTLDHLQEISIFYLLSVKFLSLCIELFLYFCHFFSQLLVVFIELVVFFFAVSEFIVFLATDHNIVGLLCHGFAIYKNYYITSGVDSELKYYCFDRSGLFAKIEIVWLSIILGLWMD